jgi:hypothetical protein
VLDADPMPATGPREDLTAALAQLLRHPFRTLLPLWSWKAAMVSAVLRASTFFATNLRAGDAAAIRAGAVEALFAIFAAGGMGSISQRLRLARPAWATALIVWLAMPMTMLLAQLAVHRLAGTPHLGMGLAASFCFAAIASSFSWYAMRHGALLGGDAETSLYHDARHLPRIVLGYVLAGPRTLFAKRKAGDK